MADQNAKQNNEQGGNRNININAGGDFDNEGQIAVGDIVHGDKKVSNAPVVVLGIVAIVALVLATFVILWLSSQEDDAIVNSDISDFQVENPLDLTPLPTNPPSPTPFPTATPEPTETPIPTPTFSPTYIAGFEPSMSAIKGYEVVLVPEGALEISGESFPVAAFWIGQFEVTNAQYATFLNANSINCRDGYDCIDQDSVWGQISRSGGEWVAASDKSAHPVVEVSWYGALDFCDRLGGRLPTLAEWYKAASWHPVTGSLSSYPWGEYAPVPELANYGRFYSETTPRGSFPNGRSHVGAYDMSGNVWEFIAQTGRNSTNRHWLGGAWDSPSSQIDIFESKQGSGGTTNPNLGFRCAFDIAP